MGIRCSSKYGCRLATLKYDKYNRETPVKQFEKLSTNDVRSTEVLSEKSFSAKEKFIADLDSLVVNLVKAVSAVKQAHAQHLKEEFVGVVSTVAAETQAIINEIRNYEDFWNWFVKNEKVFHAIVKEGKDIEKHFF